MIVVAAVLLAIFVVPSPWRIPLVLGAGAVEIAESWLVIRFTRHRRPAVGPETLVGRSGRVVEACRPLGRVRVGGELWRARCEAGADEGVSVVVRGLDGLTLVVESAPG